MDTVLRREEKYLVSESEALMLSNRFGSIMSRDSNSQEGSYNIRSLYFDTLEDKDFFDKVGEQYLRHKVRLRIYSPNDSMAKIELKQKQGVFQKKRTFRISRIDAEQLISGNKSVLLKYKNSFTDEIYSIMCMGCYMPKTIVEYKREAFVAKENDIRITFDRGIRATESGFNFFDENLLLYPVFDQEQVVIEVKYNRFMLSYISEIISSLDRRMVSSSKYCLGRSIGYPLQL